MQSTTVERVCEKCGQAFRVPASQLAHTPARYCSRACAAAGRRNRESRLCEQCGASFEVSKYRVDQGGGRWCSRACADIGRKAGEHRTCKVCGSAFYAYPSVLKKDGRTNEYCSRECYYTVIGKALKGRPKSPEQRMTQSLKMKGRQVPSRQKPPVQIQCLNCGGTREYDGRHTYRAKESRFCSTKCWYTYVRNHPDEAGQYVGGLCTGYGPNWKEQARLARERDDDTCQDCGLHQIRPRLDVHHVTARRHFNGDWRAANDLHNLVTLCKACHTAREATLRAAIRAMKR